jgi:hypothetical protein
MVFLIDRILRYRKILLGEQPYSYLVETVSMKQQPLSKHFDFGRREMARLPCIIL